MHKDRRKRFLRDQKKKRLKKARAASEPVNLRKFKRFDKLVGCNDALDLYFTPATGYYYRVVHNPPEWNDQLVQSEQRFEGLTTSKANIPDTIEEGSSIEEQNDHISDWALSFNIDDKQLAINYWANYNLRKNDNQKSNYVRRKGSVIALYRFTPEAGLIQRVPDDDGHVVLVEYDNFVLENYRVTEFELKPLTDYRDGQE